MHTKFFCGLMVLIGVLAPIFAFADSNNITALVFTTTPETIAPNTLSAAITVGTVNSTGDSEKVSETNILGLLTTSATGQFLNPSGGVFSPTMNSNTATRTFYYEDSTPGTYTITATITGKTSGRQFSATQQIIISSSGGSDSDNSSSSSDNSNSTTTDNSGSSSTDNSSDNSSSSSNNNQSYAYSSQVEAYVGPEQEPFQISIGRDRVTTVGTPISFEAEFVSGDKDYGGMLFDWSFGDGTSWDGASPTHTYLYPGDYIVVLNTSRYGNEAVSETHVKVLSPQVSISSNANCVTITNASDYELNVGGFAVVTGSVRFVIPKDTLIGANSETHIPRTVMQNENVSGAMALFDPSSDQIAATVADASLAVANNAVISTLDASTTMITLPNGMSVDDFSAKFKQDYALAMARKNSQSGADAALGHGQAPPTSSPSVASAETSVPTASSSEAAGVIYSIPHDSGGGIFSGVGSWLGHIFGK